MSHTFRSPKYNAVLAQEIAWGKAIAENPDVPPLMVRPNYIPPTTEEMADFAKAVRDQADSDLLTDPADLTEHEGWYVVPFMGCWSHNTLNVEIFPDGDQFIISIDCIRQNERHSSFRKAARAAIEAAT